MMKKLFTFLLALTASVGMMNAKVTWNSSNISDLDVYGTYQSYSKEGVTLSANADMIDAWWQGFGDESHDGISFNAHATGGFTFSNSLGKNFTKIEMTLNGSGGWDYANLGSGWSFYWDYMEPESPATVTWTGNASTVDLLKEASDFGGENVKSIVFYFVGDSEEPDPTYTVALKAGTVNADKVTLSATSAVEGATITVTPNEEYEITAFKATYNTTEEAASTLNTETGAYSFTMPAYDVTIEATIAAKPVPEGDIFAGFTATAGSGGFDNEDHAKLVDNKYISSNWTKWCANDDKKSVPTGESGDACWWIDFEASAALDLTGYILTTGNDTGNEHGRNPKNWVLKAKLNADDAWTTIATVTNDVTMKNLSFKDYKFFVDQSGSYKYFRFEVFANQGANVMQLCELRLIGTEAPADNSVKLYHNFYGDWMETEAFGIFDDYTSEYAKISMILEPGDYQFALKVGGELRGDGTAFSRDKQACILAEGFTANLTLNVDVKGTYRFYWFFDENRFAMDVPNVCGMYWQDVTDDKFEVTLGKESEVTLPTVFTTNMGFASNIFNGVDQVRLVSTDETVATIEYTLSMDGLGTITIHKAGECDIYAVHDITDYYCYDSCAFHLTVLPEPTPEPGYAEIIFLEAVAKDDLAADASFGLLGTDFSVTITDTDNKMSIDGNSCRFGGAEDYKSYSFRLKSGGKSSSKNFITLNIPAAGKLRLAVRSGNNEATDRNLVITQGEKELYNAVIQESMATEVTEGETQVKVYPYVEVAVAAGTVRLTYPVNGLNFYSFGFMEVSTPTGVDEIANGKSQTIKVIRDGQLLIIRDGKIYNVMGTVVR